MPDNLSVLTFPLVASPASNTAYGEIEVPFNADVTDVTAVVTTAPATADLPIDILKNGTSIFTNPIGTVATNSPMAIGDTVLYLEFAGNAAPDLQPGAQITVDSETFTVAPQSTSGTGKVTGGVQGSSKVDGGQPVYAVAVTVAATAAHTAGTSVYPTKPSVAVGATESSLAANPAWSATPTVQEGDVLQLKVLTGTFTAAANLEVSVELAQR